MLLRPTTCSVSNVMLERPAPGSDIARQSVRIIQPKLLVAKSNSTPLSTHQLHLHLNGAISQVQQVTRTIHCETRPEKPVLAFFLVHSNDVLLSASLQIKHIEQWPSWRILTLK